jgi:hypothetical protein
MRAARLVVQQISLPLSETAGLRLRRLTPGGSLAPLGMFSRCVRASPRD